VLAMWPPYSVRGSAAAECGKCSAEFGCSHNGLSVSRCVTKVSDKMAEAKVTEKSENSLVPHSFGLLVKFDKILRGSCEKHFQFNLGIS